MVIFWISFNLVYLECFLFSLGESMKYFLLICLGGSVNRIWILVCFLVRKFQLKELLLCSEAKSPWTFELRATSCKLQITSARHDQLWMELKWVWAHLNCQDDSSYSLFFNKVRDIERLWISAVFRMVNKYNILEYS